MNIEFANTIPLTQILSKLGLTAITQENGILSYYSPLNPEKPLSLFVNEERNDWVDYTLGKSGNTFDFVCAYLNSQNENCRPTDALRWLNNIAGYVPRLAPEILPASEVDNSFQLRAISPIRKIQLVQYLRTLGISIDLAKKHLRQIRLYNAQTKKYLYVLGYQNEDKGWYLRSHHTKILLNPQSITFIRGKIPKPDEVHIFKSIFDYLSYLTHKDSKELNEDSIILNNYRCLQDASAYIKNYGYRTAYTWMDNDLVGNIATEELAKFFATEENLKHQKQNHRYAPHKSLADWHLHQCGLPNQTCPITVE
jgi:hypothetical protein